MSSQKMNKTITIIELFTDFCNDFCQDYLEESANEVAHTFAKAIKNKDKGYTRKLITALDNLELKQKDTNAPTKPLTAYLAWTKENKEDLKAGFDAKEHFDENGFERLNDPTVKGRYAIYCGLLWDLIKGKEPRLTYEKNAKEESETWKIDMKAHEENGEKKWVNVPKKATRGSGSKSSTLKKDANGPDLPKNYYTIFQNEKKEEYKKKAEARNERNKEKEDYIPVTGQVLLAQAWKNMTDDEKEPYQEKAKAEKARYERELAEYNDGTWSKKAKSKSSSPPAPRRGIIEPPLRQPSCSVKPPFEEEEVPKPPRRETKTARSPSPPTTRRRFAPIQEPKDESEEETNETEEPTEDPDEDVMGTLLGGDAEETWDAEPKDEPKPEKPKKSSPPAPATQSRRVR